MLVFADAQSLDICGPLEVFALASRQLQEDAPGSEPAYEVRILARDTGPVPMAAGMQLIADLSCAQLPETADTLLVTGGMDDALDQARADTVLVAWLRDAASRVRRVGSVCNGALLLAEAGLLDGREATTHWSDVAELQQRYPLVRVVPDAIYTRTGHVWTSAGVTSGMDLALAMVAADHGQSLALKVARRMVLAGRRSGGQSQFSSLLRELDVPDAFAQLAQWIRDNLHTHLDVERLAARMHVSPRQFARRFRVAFGTTPQKYVEQLRVEAAQSLLEHTTKDLKRIAADCGFGSEEAMRRSFIRQVGIRPSDYRQRHATA